MDLRSIKRIRKDHLDFINTIESMIKRILNRQGISTKDYMSLYNQIYVRCSSAASYRFDFTGEEPVTLKTAVFELIKQSLNRNVCEFSEKCSTPTDDESLLIAYVKEYYEYKFTTDYLSGACAYVNCTSDKDRGLRIDEVSKQLWGKQLLQAIGSRISKAVFSLIEKQWNGEYVDNSLIKNVMNSFRDIGCIKNQNNVLVNVFDVTFGAEILVFTENYYLRERLHLINNNPFGECVKKISLRLKQEKDRFENTLFKPLIEIVEKILVLDIFEQYIEEFVQNLKSGSIEELKTIYILVAKHPQQLQSLVNHFGQHIKEKALQDIESNATVYSEDANKYIDSILKAHNESKNILFESFDCNQLFERALSMTLVDILGDNQVVKNTRNPYKSSEFLAKYCDQILKKSGNNADQLVKPALELFRFIPNKDVFQEFYLQLLASRLIQDQADCDDIEKGVLIQLKEICGVDYTNKMQKLFQDIEHSRQLNAEFKQISKANNDFNIKVISEMVSCFPKSLTELNCPQSIVDLESAFRKFYVGKHSGRKLTFLYNLTKGEIVANNLNRYTITASALQMIVLLQFNDFQQLNLNDLVNMTKINKRVIIEVLKLLLKIKLLLCDEWDEKNKTFNAKDSSIIGVNNSFKYKKFKMNINVPLKIETEEQDSKTYRHVEQQHKFIIDAAIVRTMKTKKRLQHKQLVLEVIQQTRIQSKTFNTDIKNRIESLIEREYLERQSVTSDGQRYDIYIYKA